MIDSLLMQNFHVTREKRADPALQEEISFLENHLHIKFHEDFNQFYLINQGESWDDRELLFGQGFGRFHDFETIQESYNFHIKNNLYPFNELIGLKLKCWEKTFFPFWTNGPESIFSGMLDGQHVLMMMNLERSKLMTVHMTLSELFDIQIENLRQGKRYLMDHGKFSELWNGGPVFWTTDRVRNFLGTEKL